MAERPVFQPIMEAPYARMCPTVFPYCPGFSLQQNRRSIENLHRAYRETHPGERVLEISRKSPEALGVALSAFHLTLTTGEHGPVPVEVLYQAGKVFADGEENRQILDLMPAEAKKWAKSKAGTPLDHVVFEGQRFPLVPRNFFYDWLYLCALREHPELGEAMMEYDAFTDIVFAPRKSVNCQAWAAASYVALRRLRLLDRVMESPDRFRSALWGRAGE